MIFKTLINRDIVYLRDRIHKTNVNCQRNYLITKSDDSIDERRRILSNDNDIQEQSKRHCFDKKFSISRTNKAHQYSNSLHQRKSDRRFYRLNLRVYRSNDNWWFDKIINQKQIYSISRRFKNRIIIFSTTCFVKVYQRFRDNDLWKLNNESMFSMKIESNSHLITSFFSI